MYPDESKEMKDEMSHLLHQLDLGAGYHSIHRYDTFSQDLVEHYRSLLPDGGMIPIYEAQFSVKIKGSRFTLFCRNLPILEGGIGIGNDSTWDELHEVVRSLGWIIQAKARGRLWVAEVHLPCLYELEEDPINWVFDFIRYLAAAMVDSEANRPVGS